jgi:hypothetical protein
VRKVVSSSSIPRGPAPRPSPQLVFLGEALACFNHRSSLSNLTIIKKHLNGVPDLPTICLCVLTPSPFLVPDVGEQQYTDGDVIVRAQKSVGLVGGSPNYAPLEGFQAPDVAARTYQYSSDGRLFAIALLSGYVPVHLSCFSITGTKCVGLISVKIYQAENAQLLKELELPNVVEINFSPRGTYISTWERPGALLAFSSRFS